MIADKSQAEMRDAGTHKTLQPFDGRIPRSGEGRLVFSQFVGRQVVVVREVSVDPSVRRRVVVADGKGQIGGSGNFRGIPACIAGVSRDFLPFLGVDSAVLRARRHPTVVIARGALQGARHAAATPYARPTGSIGFEAQHAIFHSPAAVPVHGFTGPKGLTKAQPLQQGTNPFLEWHASGLEFLVNGRDILANANADNDPAFADLIQSRQLLG